MPGAPSVRVSEAEMAQHRELKKEMKIDSPLGHRAIGSRANASTGNQLVIYGTVSRVCALERSSHRVEQPPTGRQPNEASNESGIPRKTGQGAFIHNAGYCMTLILCFHGCTL